MPSPQSTDPDTTTTTTIEAPATVLVLGGRGFIGGHTVQALIRSGNRVIIGSRFGAKATETQLEQRQCRFQELQDSSAWDALLNGIDVVINCVGILRQRWRERFQAIHQHAPLALALACTERNLRMLHVSALGLHADAGSGFIRSKLAGEQGLQKTEGEIVIVRPSLLDGDDGFGAWWLRTLARMPLYLLPSSSQGRLACMSVDDLAEALAAMANANDAEILQWAPERVVELGGAEEFVLRDYLHRLRGGVRRSSVIQIPHWLCRSFSHICDFLHLTPYSFGHLELLARDNAPRPNALADILGREPTPIAAWNEPARIIAATTPVEAASSRTNCS